MAPISLASACSLMAEPASSASMRSPTDDRPVRLPEVGVVDRPSEMQIFCTFGDMVAIWPRSNFEICPGSTPVRFES